MSDRPLLRARQVRVLHRGAAHPTPNGVGFDVRHGEAVLVLGPSGCGKSTFALTLNGLIPHAVWAETDGEIELGGTDLRAGRVADAAAHVAMVFQDADAQLVAETVEDEVAFAPENLLVPAAEIEHRVTDALSRVGLLQRRHDAPERLSGGQRQRLAIAAALAQGAPLMVLDEPTANLDTAAARDLYTLLEELRADGLGLVIIEHNLDEALRVATRVVVLDARGRVAVDGDPREVLAGRAAELAALGVWLPTAVMAGTRLRELGWPIDELPLTGEELRAAVTIDGLPATAVSDRATARADAVPQTGAPALALHNVSLLRDDKHVLDDVNLEVPRGALVALVGANGAGKTTLLHTIAGLHPEHTGTITVAGRPTDRLRMSELRQEIGMVAQNPEHQFLTATVFDELALELRAAGLREVELTARVNELLERFGLAGLGHVHPFLLSGGQKRRLSVATALHAGAPVLLLDEPTFGQDRDRAAELIAMLEELRAQGTTIVIATHDLQLVAEHADLLAVVSDGRIAAAGPTGDLLDSQALRAAGIERPPLARAFADLPPAHPLHSITRMRDLPRFPGAGA